jgi:ligand-binding sensor domain-containing protein
MPFYGSGVVPRLKNNSLINVVLPQPRLVQIACLLGVIASTLVSARADVNSMWAVRVWTADGLTERMINGVAQMPDGFLWVATDRRLARFDGSHFEEFRLSDLAPAGDRRIRALTASSRGELWVATDGKQIVCIRATGVRVYSDGVPSSAPESIVEDRAGAIWITYARGEVCRIKDEQITTFGESAGLETHRCILAVDREGKLWFAQNGEIGIFRDDHFEKLHQRATNSARLIGAATGGVWVVASNGVFSLAEGGALRRLEGQTTTHVGGVPTALLEDHQGALWIGTLGDGLFRYTRETGLERVPTSYPEVVSLAEDSEGSIWAGTAGGGLNRVSARATTMEGGATGLPDQAIQSICQDSEGTFWAATPNGALMWRITGAWQVLRAPVPAGITCVTADPRGGLWLGTRKHALARLRNGKVETWGPNDGLVSHTVSIIVVAPDGAVWFSGEGPTSVQCLRDGKLSNFQLPGSATMVHAMSVDAAGHIWIGLDRGVLWRVEGNEIVDATPPGAPRSNIRGLQPMPDGTLWLAYKSAGLGCLRDGRLTRIGTEHGLYSNSISHVAADDRGWLWCGGDDGVFKIRLQALGDFVAGRARRVQSVHYGAAEGLPNSQVTAKAWGSALHSQDGRIWIPMGTALLVADPSRAHENLTPPPVLLTHAKVDGQLVAFYGGVLPPGAPAWSKKLSRLPMAEPLLLAPIRQNIEFDFTALSFKAPENVHFRYRFEGLDEEWIDGGSTRLAKYARVPAGSYRFRVQACNSDGVWNDAGATLAFIVAPFFWQTWWFRGVAFLGFTALTTGIVRRVSHRRLQRKVRVLREQMALERERGRIARDLHDDAGNRLTRVMLLSKLARRECAANDQAMAHLVQLSTAAREATDAFDEIVWSVNPHNDNLAELVAYLGQFAA